MKVAHLIMAHKGPAQLERLIKAMDHPNFYFYIHIDKKVRILDFHDLSNLNRVFFIKNRTACNWGGFSIVNAIINSMDEIFLEKQEYDFINLMSGQDYPLKSSQALSKYLEDNRDKNFISFDESLDSIWWKSAKDRFEKFHLTDYNFKGSFFLEKVINLLIPKRVIPYKFKLYGGTYSTWWTISGKCAKFLVENFRNEKELMCFSKYSWGTDEYLLTTLIMNSKFKLNTVNDNLRYIDWSENAPNPKILTQVDFESLKYANSFFARKFDIEKNSEILDMIDQRLLGIPTFSNS